MATEVVQVDRVQYAMWAALFFNGRHDAGQAARMVLQRRTAGRRKNIATAVCVYIGRTNRSPDNIASTTVS